VIDTRRLRTRRARRNSASVARRRGQVLTARRRRCRMTVTDGGDKNPIGDNKTAAGRKMNRRSRSNSAPGKPASSRHRRVRAARSAARTRPFPGKHRAHFHQFRRPSHANASGIAEIAGHHPCLHCAARRMERTPGRRRQARDPFGRWTFVARSVAALSSRGSGVVYLGTSDGQTYRSDEEEGSGAHRAGHRRRDMYRHHSGASHGPAQAYIGAWTGSQRRRPFRVGRRRRAWRAWQYPSRRHRFADSTFAAISPTI